MEAPSVDRLLGIAGVGLAILGIFAPYIWKDPPDYISFPMIAIGVCLVLFSIAHAMRWHSSLSHYLRGPKNIQVLPSSVSAVVNPDDLIPLADAAKSLYEFARVKGSLLATAAEQISGSNNGNIVAGTPEDVLDYMATYIGGKACIFGARPPSDKRELIQEEEVKRGAFESGALILKTNRHVFTDLAVARRDMQALVSYLESNEI
jgi:hypothetical protein